MNFNAKTNVFGFLFICELILPLDLAGSSCSYVAHEIIPSISNPRKNYCKAMIWNFIVDENDNTKVIWDENLI